MRTLRVAAVIGRTPIAVRYEGPVSPNPDAALPTFLLAAMRRGEPLVLEDPVSQSALAAAAEVQRVLSMWWPQLYRRVEVRAPSRPDASESRPDDAVVSSFFSGGVDSFYSALTRDDVTHLVFVHGFDVALSDGSLRERAARAAREAAAALGKPLLEVETDVRVALDVNWEHQHGAAMVAVGMLLDPRPGTVVIPATFTYRDLFPWGSHPLLDPLWGTAAQRVVHHAAGVTRFEKTGAIAASDTALTHLRVCWKNPGGAYNCGHCLKCLRTMTALRLHDRLDACQTLPSELDVAAVARMRPRTDEDLAFTRENLAAAHAQGDAALATALARSLRNGRIRRAVAPIADPLIRAVRRVRSIGP